MLAFIFLVNYILDIHSIVLNQLSNIPTDERVFRNFTVCQPHQLLRDMRVRYYQQIPHDITSRICFCKHQLLLTS